MKKIIIVLYFFVSTSFLFSQDDKPYPRYLTNRFWDNWFINIGGGGGMFFGGKQFKEASFIDRLTWASHISVGKWFSPLVGARLTFQGGQKHTFNPNGIPVFDENRNPVDISTLDPKLIHHMLSGYYITVHADAMLDLSSLFYGYKDARTYSLISYAGAGIGTDRNAIDNNSPVILLGLLNTFRINKNFAISLDISAQAVQSKFNDSKYPKRWTKSYKKQDWDGIGSVNLGFILGLGGKQIFEKADKVHVVDNAYNNELVNKLTNQIDSLNNENKLLAEYLDKIKNVPPKVEISREVIIKNNPYPIQFKINSSIINSKQEAIIYNIADFLKNNEDCIVEIVGLCDSKTGTKKYNEALSIKRAKSVENKLIKQYGISKDRIISIGKGDSIQPYPNNDWNRVVIMTLVHPN